MGGTVKKIVKPATTAIGGSLGGIGGAIIGRNAGKELTRGGKRGGGRRSSRSRQMSPAQMRKFTDEQRKVRDRDFSAGLKRGRSLFKSGSLGRVDDARSQEVSDIIDQRRALQQQGIDPRQIEADNFARARTEQAQQRQLLGSQGRLGLQGGAGALALQNLQRQQAENEAQQNLQRTLQNEQLREARLGGLESSIGQAREDELRRQQFNLNQIGRERAGQLSTALGEQQFGAADRGAFQQTQIGQAMADATRAQAAMGGRQKK